MREELIKFDTAILAKEKGFDYDTDDYYSSKTKVTSVSYNEYPAPTQSLLQKWLREKHNIHIVVNIGIPHGSKYCSFYSNVIRFNKTHKSKFRSEFYKSHEDALESGLFNALELIK